MQGGPVLADTSVFNISEQNISDKLEQLKLRNWGVGSVKGRHRSTVSHRCFAPLTRVIRVHITYEMSMSIASYRRQKNHQKNWRAVWSSIHTTAFNKLQLQM